MTTHAPPDSGQTAISPEQFLHHFPGHWVQHFDDGPLKDRRKALATPHFDGEEARRKQQAGCGVFFSPNAFDGLRRIENLRQVQAVYIDIDFMHEGDGTPEAEFQSRLTDARAALRMCPRPPHAVIQTKNGLQAIWRVEPMTAAEGVPLFQETVDLLIRHFRADPAARDVTRVLRLPGFLHLKNPARPFLCTLLHDALASKPYRLADLKDALQAVPNARLHKQAAAAQSPNPPPVKRWADALDGVALGARNDAAAAVAGMLLKELAPELWETAVWGGLKEWNGRNAPPLPEAELRAVFESIARRERAQREAGARNDEHDTGRSQADKLIALATQEQALFFRDQLGSPHASIRIGDHQETWRVRSKPMRMWLSSLLWESEMRAPSSNAMVSALTILEGRAFFGGKRIPLHNRVAWHDGALWYDLTNERWEAVRVTASGWEVVKSPPVLFHRHAHAEPQLKPKAGGDARAFLRFVNVADAHQQVLLLVYLVSCFLPDIPHPVALLYGPQGSAKTTLARMLRRLIDPSIVQVMALPTSMPALVQQLSHHWFAFFDNVSDLPEWASDSLCRAVTGEGFSKRELYSDDEDMLYAFRRCVGINGINLAARKADLLDRALLFKLSRVPKENRQSERALWANFEEVLPSILGGIFDALSAALRLRPRVELAATPRMADFTEWGHAAAEALGFGPDQFLAAYQHNQQEQHEEAINENIVAWTLMTFMHDRRNWDGSPSDLLRALAGTAEREGISTKIAAWPNLPNALMRRLNEAKTSLAEVGITFESCKVAQGRRLIRVQKSADPAAVSAAPQLHTPSGSTRRPNRAVAGGDERGSGEKWRGAAPPAPGLPEAENRARGDGGDDCRTSPRAHRHHPADSQFLSSLGAGTQHQLGRFLPSP